MPNKKTKSIWRRQARAEKLERLRAQYESGKRSKSEILGKVKLVCPHLSEKEFIASITKK